MWRDALKLSVPLRNLKHVSQCIKYILKAQHIMFQEATPHTLPYSTVTFWVKELCSVISAPSSSVLFDASRKTARLALNVLGDPKKSSKGSAPYFTFVLLLIPTSRQAGYQLKWFSPSHARGLNPSWNLNPTVQNPDPCLALPWICPSSHWILCKTFNWILHMIVFAHPGV